jgi:hypothetical protein
MTNSGENGDLVRVRPPRVESSADGVKPGAEGQLAATRMNGGMALHEVHSSRVRCRCGAQCWRTRGCERRYTVPKAIKLKLCELAIAYVMELHRQAKDARPEIEESLQRSMSAAEAELGDRGWTAEEIAAWFKKLSERARKRSKKEFKKPSVDRVFEIVIRRAPAVTLRRKARSPCR